MVEGQQNHALVSGAGEVVGIFGKVSLELHRAMLEHPLDFSLGLLVGIEQHKCINRILKLR